MSIAFWLMVGNVGRRLTEWSVRHLETRHFVDQVKEELEWRSPHITSAIVSPVAGEANQIDSAPSSNSIEVRAAANSIGEELAAVRWDDTGLTERGYLTQSGGLRRVEKENGQA